MNKLLLALFVFLTPAVALAESSPPPGSSSFASAPELSVRLIAPVTAIGPTTDSLDLGLEVTPQTGWKTYWRSPGSAGLPVSIDWTDSENLTKAELSWPAPLRFTFEGLETFGYNQPHILPLHVTLTNKGQPLRLQAKIETMACEHICIPFTFALSFFLPAGDPAETPFAAQIAEAQSKVPGDGRKDGLSVQSVALEDGAIKVLVNATPPLTAPDMLIESRGFMFGKPSYQTGTPATLIAPVLAHPRNRPLPDPTRPLTITLIDGDRLLETVKTPDLQATTPPPLTPDVIPPVVPEAVPLSFSKLLTVLLGAFVGGMILNLMPCVLPVLSLKLLAVIGHAGSPPRHVRASFLASAAGIITSFLALAAIAVSLRSAGHAIGWGIQFQHPTFLISLMLILTLFAASLWGLIQIPLPRFLADAINDRLPGPGEHDRTLLGNFLTGAFATLLATPCSAPFVGTAIGFALTGSDAVLFMVALAMGLGLALPFLLVALFPKTARFLPKPGRWMNWLKAILGLALMATVIWLTGVLGALWPAPSMAASLAGGSMLLLLFALWIAASIKRPTLFYRGIVAIILFILLAAGMEELSRKMGRTEETAVAASLQWQNFNEDTIPALVAQGKIVFVDVTAEWCLTCLANKQLVLDQPEVIEKLSAEGIVLMKADWTKPDPAIGAYLKRYNRYGIPFNIVYGPGAPEGLPLPELLNRDAILAALKLAATSH